MNYVRCFKTAFLIVILISFAGCKSKQDTSGTNSAAPQGKTAGPVVPTKDKSTAPVVPSQDKADAQAVAIRVLALLERGDFPAIYKDSAAGFKQIGSESDFVAKFQKSRERVGLLKNPQLISFGTLPGIGYVLVYRLENEHYKTDMRLSFARSPQGKMELAGLNQHDELKK